MMWRCCIVLIGSIPTLLNAESGGQNEEASGGLLDLMSVWVARSETVNSVSAKVEVQDDAYSDFSNRQSEWIPKDDRLREQRSSTLTIKGGKVRQDSIGWTYDEHMMGISIFDYQRDVGDFVSLRKKLATGRFKRSLYSHFMNVKDERRNPQRYIFTYDGKDRSNFWDGNGENHPRRIFQRAPAPHSASLAYRAVYFESMFDGGIDLDHLLCQPLIFHFRPLDPRLGGVYRDNCSLTDKAVINGRQCWILREDSLVPNEYRRYFFVDPERDWIVTRYVGDAGKHGKLQFDIDSVQDARGMWLPNKWRILRVEAADRPIQSFVTVELSDYSINPKQELDVSQPNVPAGTWNIQMWVYTIHHESLQSITRADGTERQVLELETDVLTPYEILVNSEVGQGYFEEQRRLRWGLLRYLADARAILVYGVLLCVCPFFPWSSTRRLFAEYFGKQPQPEPSSSSKVTE